MSKIKAYLGLKLVNAGIWIYGVNAGAAWLNEDYEAVKKLLALRDKFKKELKGGAND